jgi:hypothetical protein
MAESLDSMINTKNNDNRNYKLILNKYSSASSTGSKSPYNIVNTEDSDYDKSGSNLKFRPRPPTFTYIEDINNNSAPGKIIDFDNPTSGFYLDIDGLNRFLAEFLNNYNSDSFNSYLNYAKGQADSARHECGPTHDEKVKWRLRDINSKHLQPMLRTINGVDGIVSNNTFIKQNLTGGSSYLNDKISLLAKRLELINQYNNYTLGTPEQIVSIITSYFKNLIDVVNADTAIINKNLEIVTNANSNLVTSTERSETNLLVANDAIEKAEKENGYLWTSTKEKVTKYYNEIIDQNDLLTDKKEKVTGYYTKMERQFEFQQANIPMVSNIETYLYIIYYALIVVWIFFLFRSNNGFSFRRKLGLIFILLLFPFIVYYIEFTIHNIFRYLYSFVTNKPFNNKNFNYDPTKGDNYLGDVLSRDHVKTTDGSSYEVSDNTNGFDQLEKSNFSAMGNNPIIKLGNYIGNYFHKKISSFNFNNTLNSVVNGG